MLIEPGKHEKEEAINKQLNDKERILAALEVENVKSIITVKIEMVFKGIKHSDDLGQL